MATNFRIVPRIRTPELNPGETAVIDLYVTGSGELRTNKLLFIHGYPNLTESDVGVARVGYKPKKEGVLPYANAKDPDEFEHSLDDSGTVLNIPYHYSYSIPDNIEENLNHTTYGDDEEGVLEPDMFDHVLGEMKYEGVPPIQFRLNISEEANPGDYELTFIYYYEAGTEIWSDREEVTLHVNTMAEQWAPWPTVAGIAAAIIALLSLMAQAGFFSFVFNYLGRTIDFYMRFFSQIV
jgi:hypothetical protein